VSGGLDSTTIAALATGIARGRGAPPPVLVTARYPDEPTDETPITATLAEHLGVPLHVHDMPRGPGSFPVSTSPEALWDPYTTLLEGMRATMRAHGCYALSMGFGGDEVQRVTGYEVDESLATGELVGAARWAGPQTEGWALRRLTTTTLRRLAGRSRQPAPLDAPPILTPDARTTVQNAQQERHERLQLSTYGSAKRVLYASFVEGDAAPAGLVQGAHTAALLGVSFLQPYLDVRVVELMLALPLSVRPDPFGRKPLLRTISASVAPASISARFGRADFTPFYQRVVRENAEAYRAVLEGRRLEALGLVRFDATLATLGASEDRARLRDALSLITYEGWLAAVEARTPEPTSGPSAAVNGSAETSIVW
jgi:asparagine synthetase B (glutamine-hydrolysing)